MSVFRDPLWGFNYCNLIKILGGFSPRFLNIHTYMPQLIVVFSSSLHGGKKHNYVRHSCAKQWKSIISFSFCSRVTAGLFELC